MAHHQLRGEVVLDDERAEDRLAHHAERQQRPDQHQVPAIGAAEEGEDGGGDHREPTRPVISRLPYSITAWNSSGGTVLP